MSALGAETPQYGGITVDVRGNDEALNVYGQEEVSSSLAISDAVAKQRQVLMSLDIEFRHFSTDCVKQAMVTLNECSWVYAN